MTDNTVVKQFAAAMLARMATLDPDIINIVTDNFSDLLMRDEDGDVKDETESKATEAS